MRKFAILIAAAVLFAPLSAMAQGGGPPSPPPFSVLSGQAQLPASAVTANVALPSAAISAKAVSIYNGGPADVYFALGATNAVTATTSSPELPSGKCLVMWSGANHYLAAITALDVSLVIVNQGSGPLCPQ